MPVDEIIQGFTDIVPMFSQEPRRPVYFSPRTKKPYSE